MCETNLHRKFSMIPQNAQKQAIEVDNATANHPRTCRFDK